MLPQPTRDEIKLRRENARLKERIKALEETLGVGEDEVATLQLVFGLKRKAAQIFAIIKRRQGVISKDVIYHILYGGLPECEQPTIKTIEVHMVAIRAALWTHGIVIRTVAVGGYVLDAGARARLATLMGEYQASQAAITLEMPSRFELPAQDAPLGVAAC